MLDETNVDRDLHDGLDDSVHSTRPEAQFEIRVMGHLDSKWWDWLEGLEVKLLDNGEMILVGYVEDQAALIGLLNKLNRLNLTLLAVSQVNPEQSRSGAPRQGR